MYKYTIFYSVSGKMHPFTTHGTRHELSGDNYRKELVIFDGDREKARFGSYTAFVSNPVQERHVVDKEISLDDPKED